jgi:predicted nucleotidyltransferase
MPVTDLIAQHRASIETLCRTFHVRRLDVFGSVLRDDFDEERSDVDFIVEFDHDAGLNTFRAYMDLRLALAELLGRQVDLVMDGAIRNRYLRSEIESTRVPLYAA